MYETILVTLDTTPTDRAIIEHVKKLAALAGSRVQLLHVATGVPAVVHGGQAAGQEVDDDSAYLNRVQQEFEAAGIPAKADLAFGDPAKEIIRWVAEKKCDLVAMSTHGHQFFADLVLGQTVSKVRHSVTIPVLLLRGK